MANPLSPDHDVTGAEKFRDGGISKLGYRVRVSESTLERAVTAKGINTPASLRHAADRPDRGDVVVCQCDGTANQVDACLMGMKMREMRTTGLRDGVIPQEQILALPDLASLENHPLALVSVRAQCSRQAKDTLFDFQGA